MTTGEPPPCPVGLINVILLKCYVTAVDVVNSPGTLFAAFNVRGSTILKFTQKSKYIHRNDGEKS